MRIDYLLRLYHKINIPAIKYLGIMMLRFVGMRYLVVRMDTNYLCNLKCRMCYFSGSDIVTRKPMSLDFYDKIALNIFRKVRVLYLSCGAEPFMTRDFIEFIRIARKYKVPNISFVTNGTLLNEDKIKDIVELGVNEVIISLDGATAETYEKIRTGASFECVVRNLRLFKDIKAKYATRLPHIRLNYLLMKSTISEIDLFFNLIKDLNISSVNFREIIPFETEDPEYYSRESITNDMSTYCRVQDTIRRNAGKYGINVITSISCRKQIKKHTYRRLECLFPWFSVVIENNGNFRPCLYHDPVGNFKNDSYWKVMDGAKMKGLKSSLLFRPKNSCLNICYNSTERF